MCSEVGTGLGDRCGMRARASFLGMVVEMKGCEVVVLVCPNEPWDCWPVDLRLDNLARIPKLSREPVSDFD